jgi:hypothetical protein
MLRQTCERSVKWSLGAQSGFCPRRREGLVRWLLGVGSAVEGPHRTLHC